MSVSRRGSRRENRPLADLLPPDEMERMPQLIEIVPPREEWFEDFATLKQAVMRAAPDGAYIHHIGSAAVPDLPAKDIIDLQLTVDGLAWVDDAAFERQGFKRIPGLVIDHSPPGLDLPEVELSKRFFRSMSRSANLHVREKGRFNQRYPLLCRDYLRAHPVVAGAYAQISSASPDASPLMRRPITRSKTPCSTSSWKAQTTGRRTPIGWSRRATKFCSSPI